MSEQQPLSAPSVAGDHSDSSNSSGTMTIAAKYDLTGTVAPFLDRHLVFPLLEFLQEKKIYKDEQILIAKIELLKKTNMVDYAMDIHKSLYETEEVPKEMVERRVEVVSRLKSLEESASDIVNFLQDPNLVQELRQDKHYNLHMLQQKFNIGLDAIESLYQYAKFQFECGNYSGAAEFLYQYQTLCINPERAVSASWGKLSCEILLQNWDVALEEINKLKETVDSKGFASPLNLLQQRTWLLHWSLMILFNTESGRNNLIDLFFQEKYMNAIQTNAQHLIRYLSAAVLTNRRRVLNWSHVASSSSLLPSAPSLLSSSSLLRDLVRVIERESEAYYSDPVTEFVFCLFVEYDFEGAHAKLKECEELFANDFFLSRAETDSGVSFQEDFVECARYFIVEAYCRLHKRIHISVLSEKLQLSEADGERWLLGLISSGKLDAKIDSESAMVLMNTEYPSAYESIIDKTKALTNRSYALTNNVMAAVAATAAATASMG